MSDPVRPSGRNALRAIEEAAERGYSVNALTLRMVAAYARSLEAQLATVRQQERERCAGLLIAESGRRFAKSDDDMGEHLEYLASAIRALPDREEPDA